MRRLGVPAHCNAGGRSAVVGGGADNGSGIHLPRCAERTHPFVPARRQGRLRQAAGTRQHLQGRAVGAISWRRPHPPRGGARTRRRLLNLREVHRERRVEPVDDGTAAHKVRRVHHACARKAQVKRCVRRNNQQSQTDKRKEHLGKEVATHTYCRAIHIARFISQKMAALARAASRSLTVDAKAVRLRRAAPAPSRACVTPPRASQVRYARHGHPSSVLKCVVVVG